MASHSIKIVKFVFCLVGEEKINLIDKRGEMLTRTQMFFRGCFRNNFKFLKKCLLNYHNKSLRRTPQMKMLL